MAVAFDAFKVVGSGTGNTTDTFTPVGTPKGIILLAFTNGGTDDITAATYGGVAMTEVPGSPNLKAAAESLGVYAYFLGSSIPTGAQTVTTTTGGGGFGRRVYCISLTADTDTEIVDTDASINSDSVTNPSGTLSLSSRTSFCCEVLGSGQGAITGITELSGWVARNEDVIANATCACYTYSTIGSSDVTMGWTQGADDAVCLAVAVSEVSVPKGIILLMGDGGFM